jgi:hypothetical protein
MMLHECFGHCRCQAGTEEWYSDTTPGLVAVVQRCVAEVAAAAAAAAAAVVPKAVDSARTCREVGAVDSSCAMNCATVLVAGCGNSALGVELLQDHQVAKGGSAWRHVHDGLSETRDTQLVMRVVNVDYVQVCVCGREREGGGGLGEGYERTWVLFCCKLTAGCRIA